MSISLLRNTGLRSALRVVPSTTARRAGLAGASCTRGKATLPDLPCTYCLPPSSRSASLPSSFSDADDYGALEPAISGKIMELHHSKHHQTYVNSLNAAQEQLAAAQSSQDTASQIALQPLINFHGGGHVNHTLFWENLSPTKQGGGEPPSGELARAIDGAYGSLDAMKEKFNAALAGIQGSGWAWLVQDTQTGNVLIKTYAVSQPQDQKLPV